VKQLILNEGSQPMTSPADAHGSGVSAATHYRTATIDGLNIFYREAGPKDAPVVLLLHGFPSSSRMFRNLIPQLADAYHVIAPDYAASGRMVSCPRTGPR
jgi:alpha-beta hydrolase superfamily lysophospholipase